MSRFYPRSFGPSLWEICYGKGNIGEKEAMKFKLKKKEDEGIRYTDLMIGTLFLGINNYLYIKTNVGPLILVGDESRIVGQTDVLCERYVPIRRVFKTTELDFSELE